MKLYSTILLAAMAAGAQTKTPILVELFTSEGCSSCPPADALLERLDGQPVPGVELIVLGEHVDYWNDSWRDRFSSPALTRRQWDYARSFQLQSVYTPQMVVDGQSEFVGSHGPHAKAALEKAFENPKHPVGLDVRTAGKRLQVSVRVLGLQTKGTAVFVALAENRAESRVTRGENAGRRLQHVAMVRRLESIGEVRGDFEKTLDLPAPENKEGFRVVAFLQDKATGRILGASQQRLE